MSFGLNLQGGPRILLGASPLAVNGPGMEDEPQPVGPRLGRGTAVFPPAPASAWKPTMVRWTEGGLYSWTIVAGLPAGNAQDTSADRSPFERLSLHPGLWPPGPCRANADCGFALTEGAAIPCTPASRTAWKVVAGPALEVETRLADVPTTVGAFGAGVESLERAASPCGVNLPSASRLSLKVWVPARQTTGSRVHGSSEGSYRLVRDQEMAGVIPPECTCFALEWIGGRKVGTLTRKIAIP